MMSSWTRVDNGEEGYMMGDGSQQFHLDHSLSSIVNGMRSGMLASRDNDEWPENKDIHGSNGSDVRTGEEQ